MLYIGMLIDSSVLYETDDLVGDCNYFQRLAIKCTNNFWYMQQRAKDIESWPGQKINDELFCEVC